LDRKDGLEIVAGRPLEVREAWIELGAERLEKLNVIVGERSGQMESGAKKQQVVARKQDHYSQGQSLRLHDLDRAPMDFQDQI
jgi:hypothetical protein